MIFKVKHALPWKTEAVDISAGDHTFELDPVHAVRADSSGVVYVHYAGDAVTWVKHTVVAGEDGAYILGHIDAVRQSGTTVPTADLIGLQFPVE